MQWGQNSGHVGVPLEAMPAFISRLQMCYQKATGVKAVDKSPRTPGSGGPIKGAIDKKKEGKKKDVEMKEKKEKPKPKATVEDLDAELLSYQAARAADGSAPTGMEAAPAPA